MNQKQYKEIQRLYKYNWWIYIFCVLFFGYAVWAFVMQIILDVKFGPYPYPDWVIYVTLALSVACLWFVFADKMVLKVNEKGISFREYLYFKSKKFNWTDIKEAKVIQYDPVKDYAGWNLHINWNNNRIVYYIRSNKGLELTLKNNSKVLIGTAKAEELQAFLDENKFIN